MSKLKTPDQTFIKIDSTAHDLWLALVESAGLDLKNYDGEIEEELRFRLELKGRGSLHSLLKRNKIGPEKLLAEFFESFRPYTRMYEEILDLVASIGLKEGKQNLEVEFDFDDEGNKFKFDIDSFRKQVEAFREVVRPISTESWIYDQFWNLSRILDGPRPRLRIEYESYVPPRPLANWLESYEKGVWPEHDVELPGTEDPELDSLLARVWAFRSAYLRAVRSYGPRRNDLARGDGLFGILEVVNDEFDQSPVLERQLKLLDSDNWVRNLTRAGFSAAQRAANDTSIAAYLKEHLSNFFRDIPVDSREIRDAVRDVQELLCLPIWKHRYELYSIWVLTQVIDALGGTSKFSFNLEGGVFHIPFAPRRIATLKNVQPPVHVCSEVRYRLANPVGKGKTVGIQPDYSLTIDSAIAPTTSFALIECKQYLKEARKRFGKVITRYATFAPVLLVNYGPATPKILDHVPVKLHERADIHGDLRPLEDSNIQRFTHEVRCLVNTNCTAILPAPSDHDEVESVSRFDEDSSLAQIAQEENLDEFLRMMNFFLAIKLNWNDSPSDLDLHLLVLHGDSHKHVSYADHGSVKNFPFAELGKDLQIGPGSEIILVSKPVPGIYRILVHAYSEDGSLVGSGATIMLVAQSGTVKTYTCPIQGDGRWWHVADFDGSKGTFRDIDQILAALPIGAE